MVANGQPSPEELKLLEPFRGQVPDEVFGEPFVPPVSDGSGQDRKLLRKAGQLLTDAGIVVKDGKRVLPNGQRLAIEFLIDEGTFEPHHMLFIKNARTISTSISWSSARASRQLPAIRCAPISRRPRPPNPARRTSPALPTLQSTR
jgi:microcin C transport system substrate-binding protein